MTVIHSGGRQILPTGWDPGKPCQVMLRHDTGNWGLYINTRAAYLGTHKGSLLQTNSISHIQFRGEGGEVAESSHLSLFNARLYNRRLNSKHIRWLMVGEAGQNTMMAALILRVRRRKEAEATAPILRVHRGWKVKR
ncbi:trans-sialidase [Trypanosoma cruzi]|nr:trans-sialidase [Trypanosoma cruzi]